MRKSLKRSKLIKQRKQRKQRGGKTKKLQRSDKSNYGTIADLYSEYSVFLISTHGFLDIENTVTLPENTYVLNIASLSETCGNDLQDDAIYTDDPTILLKTFTDPTSLSKLIKDGRVPFYEPNESMNSMDFVFENVASLTKEGILSAAITDVGVYKMPLTEELKHTRKLMKARAKEEFDKLWNMPLPKKREYIINPRSLLNVMIKQSNDYFLNHPTNLIKGKLASFRSDFNTIFNQIIKPNIEEGKKVLIITYACRVLPGTNLKIPAMARALSDDPSNVVMIEKIQLLRTPEVIIDKYIKDFNLNQWYKRMMATKRGKQIVAGKMEVGLILDEVIKSGGLDTLLAAVGGDDSLKSIITDLKTEGGTELLSIEEALKSGYASFQKLLITDPTLIDQLFEDPYLNMIYKFMISKELGKNIVAELLKLPLSIDEAFKKGFVRFRKAYVSSGISDEEYISFAIYDRDWQKSLSEKNANVKKQFLTVPPSKKREIASSIYRNMFAKSSAKKATKAAATEVATEAVTEAVTTTEASAGAGGP